MGSKAKGLPKNKYPAVFLKIWQACSKIPKGKVASYSFLAAQIGKPKAARVVARALARNPYAPQVPCHRVVRSNGALGGYSAPGGLARKAQLLRQEGISFVAGNRVRPDCLLQPSKKELR